MVIGLPPRWAFEMWVGQYKRKNLNPLWEVGGGKASNRLLQLYLWYQLPAILPSPCDPNKNAAPPCNPRVCGQYAPLLKRGPETQTVERKRSLLRLAKDVCL